MSRRRGPAQRRIAVITGTRAEYGLLQSTLAAIEREHRLCLQLVVTGMHLLREFGHTVDQVRRDGWPIAARVRMQAGDDGPRDQAAGLARGVAGIAEFLERDASDVVVVLGDRIEAMAGALATVSTGRVLAHVHGGDVAPGDFDDSLRHAISKLAHLHFPATRKAARRLERLGEEPSRIHCVGAVGLDRLRELLNAAPPRTRSGEALVIYHAWGRSAEIEARAMRAILNAVRAAGLRRRILYPNTDRGHRGVLRTIAAHVSRSRESEVEVVRSLPRDDYLRALLRAEVLIGNSSSGIIEAPLAGTPSVNVGPRQAHREPGGRSVIDAEESPAAVRAALHRALRSRPRRGGRNVYGDGRAGEQIARVLATVRLTDALRRKVITY